MRGIRAEQPSFPEHNLFICESYLASDMPKEDARISGFSPEEEGEIFTV
jgi:hypothetical protein